MTLKKFLAKVSAQVGEANFFVNILHNPAWQNRKFIASLDLQVFPSEGLDGRVSLFLGDPRGDEQPVGDGSTPDKAFAALIRHMRGKTLEFQARGINRKFPIPKDLT